MEKQLQLSLGPILYFWEKDKVIKFYEQMANMPLNAIYLGESVCSRRQEVRFDDWLGLAVDLSSSGKEIILSSQVLLESESDLKRLRKYVEQGDFKIEANDMGAVKLARDKALPFVAGATLNIYNEQTLALIHSLGAIRWVPPAEMSAKKIGKILAHNIDLECEVFAWGAIPLAFSARCFTARYYNLKKDSCEFKCLSHPEGLEIKTRENESFLTINGIQTMSSGCQCLMSHFEQMNAMKVNMLRLSPQEQNMSEIIQLYFSKINHQLSCEEALKELKKLSKMPLIDGYWRGGFGADAVKGEDYAIA